MDDEANESAGSGRALTPSDPAAARFVDQGDLTGLVLADAEIISASAQQSLLSGVLFRNCVFSRCSFRRADFDGAVFESCQFVDCDFSVADFRSLEAVRTEFRGCSFDAGSIRSSELRECTIRYCQLTAMSFEDNRIESSTFESDSLTRSTLLHCSFSRTVFSKTDLADCTSQYHIFDDCTFDAVRLNAEEIGLTFGLKRADLDAVELVWRGIDLQFDRSDIPLLDALHSTYSARGWRLALAVMNLNFGLEPCIAAWRGIFLSLMSSAASAIPLRTDEFRFIAGVIEALSGAGKMPLVSIAEGLDAVASAAEIKIRKDVGALKYIFHALKDAEDATLSTLDATLAALLKLKGVSAQLNVKFIFFERPPHSFSQWISELQESRLIAGPPPEYLGSARGSYIEIFSMTAGTLASILVCLSLIERIIDRLTMIRAKGTILLGAELPPAVRKRALQPVAAASPVLSRELQTYLKYALGQNGGAFLSNIDTFSSRLTGIAAQESDGGASSS